MERLRTTVPLTRKAEATRAALLDAARFSIARDGYSSAHIVDIAKRAGKSTGVFYSYFSDKHALFTALVDEFHRGLIELTPGPIQDEEQTAEAVKRAVSVFWNVYQKFQPEFAGLIEISGTDPRMLGVWRNIRRHGIKRFAYRIRKRQKLGFCAHLDPELAASALYGLLEFTCFNWQSRKLDFPDKAIDDQVAVDTLYGLIAQVLELETESAPPPRKYARRAVSK